MDDDDSVLQEGESQVRPLGEDNDTPFSPPIDPIGDPAQDVDGRINNNQLEPTHQVTDSNIDSQEAYDEGLSGAAEATEPNADNGVVGYNPDADQRKTSG